MVECNRSCNRKTEYFKELNHGYDMIRDPQKVLEDHVESTGRNLKWDHLEMIGKRTFWGRLLEAWLALTIG